VGEQENRELTITKDVEELERLEGIIHKNLQSFYEVGRALMGIRNGELYKVKNGGKYETFEAYCKGVWDFTKSYANYLVAATVVIDNISEMTTNVVKPVTEAQARSLAKLGAEKQIEAWQKAVETAPEGKVTAAHVSKVVKEMEKEEYRPRSLRLTAHRKGESILTDAMQFAWVAISHMERIAADDPKREEAFNFIINWIQEHRGEANE